MGSRAEQARAWLEQNVVILDTETTGLDNLAQVVEVAAIDCHGQVLVDTLVRPWVSPTGLLFPSEDPVPLIPPEATAIHGITDEMLKDAPGWAEVHVRFGELISNRHVVIYNAEFDTRLLQQTAEMVDLPDPLDKAASIHCAMLSYAAHHGAWNAVRKSYKWQKLTAAAQQLQIDVDGVQAHRALGDCRMTLAVIKGMAAKEGGLPA